MEKQSFIKEHQLTLSMLLSAILQVFFLLKF